MELNLDHLIRIIIVLIVAVVGSYITRENLNWLYSKTIERSSYMPKGYIFSIVWTIIYVGFAYTWCKSLKSKKFCIDRAFVVSILLNFAWVVAFFGFQLVGLSRIIISLLLVVVLYQAYQQYKIKHKLGLSIMIFYASWLVFATYLNFQTNTMLQ